MPCYDSRDHEPRIVREDTTKYTKQISKLEELLCSSCRALALLKFDFDTNPLLSKWWAKHKEEDEKRELAEAQERIASARVIELSRKPIGKLNKEEVAVLKKQGVL